MVWIEYPSDDVTKNKPKQTKKQKTKQNKTKQKQKTKTKNKTKQNKQTNKTFLEFNVLNSMYLWSMTKNIHSPNLVVISSWVAEIWPREYLISSVEISVNWPGFKQLWTGSSYTAFNAANYVFMSSFIRPLWTDSCKIWCVWVFHHIPLKYGHEHA